MPAPLLLARIRVAIGLVSLAKAIGLFWIGADWWWVAAWGTLSVALTLGIRSRLAALFLMAVGTHLMFGGYHSNHLFLLLVLFALLSLSACEERAALRPGRRGSLGVGLPLFLLRCQVSIVYGFAGLAKLNPSWLSGDALAYYLGRAMAPLPEFVGPLLPALAAGVIALELCLAVLPWFEPPRRPAIALAVLLHLGMLLVSIHWLDAFQLVIFGALMITMLSAFFESGGLWWFARRESPMAHTRKVTVGTFFAAVALASCGDAATAPEQDLTTIEGTWAGMVDLSPGDFWVDANGPEGSLTLTLCVGECEVGGVETGGFSHWGFVLDPVVTSLGHEKESAAHDQEGFAIHHTGPVLVADDHLGSTVRGDWTDVGATEMTVEVTSSITFGCAAQNLDQCGSAGGNITVITATLERLTEPGPS